MDLLMKKLFLPILLCASGGAWAECELQHETQVDVAECYIKESEYRVKSNFNKLKALTTNQNGHNKIALDNLRESQKNWLKYRDSYCETYSNYHSEINNHANCIIGLNQQRAEQLQGDIDAN